MKKGTTKTKNSPPARKRLSKKTLIATHEDNIGMDPSRLLSQFFTKDHVAQHVVDTTRKLITGQKNNWNTMTFLEPAAGDGALYYLMPPRKRIGVEVDADLCKKHGYLYCDLANGGFLDLTRKDLGLDRVPSEKVVCIMNPPFSQPRWVGRSRNIALEFFNHAATMADTIAWICGTTARRPVFQSKMDSRFHLIHDENLPRDSFTLGGEPSKIACIFQIWQVKKDGRSGKVIERSADIMIELPKIWKKCDNCDWQFVGATDLTAGVRILNWGSKDTVGRLEFGPEVKKIVRENIAKTREREKSGESMKGFFADNSHIYMQCGDPRAVAKRFRDRKYLFEQLSGDRNGSGGHNPDLSNSDLIRIYISPLGTEYNQGKWWHENQLCDDQCLIQHFYDSQR